VAGPKDDFEFGDEGAEGPPSEDRRRRPEPEPPPLRLADADFARPLSSLEPRPEEGGDSHRGGDSGRGADSQRASPLRAGDGEENLYVLLDDKPEPPSRPAYVAPKELVDFPTSPPVAEAPIGDQAPDAAEAVDEAPLAGSRDGDEPAAEEPAEVTGGRAGRRPPAAETLDAEPEFLYPKSAAATHFPVAEPRRGPSRAAQIALFALIAVVLGGAATFGVRTLLKPDGEVAPSPPPVARRGVLPVDPLQTKLHRGLAWGLPIDSGSPRPAGGDRP
jgi:hypothetical protein